DGIDGGGGSLCFPRGLGSLDRIELGTPDTATSAEYSHSDTSSGTLDSLSDAAGRVSNALRD
ncbi:hypothetical protein Tco_1190527, partial [Tanacetum coccineum]